MTPDDLQSTMDRCGWSATRLASILGVSRRQVDRWIHGHSPIHRIHTMAIERAEQMTDTPTLTLDEWTALYIELRDADSDASILADADGDVFVGHPNLHPSAMVFATRNQWVMHGDRDSDPEEFSDAQVRDWADSMDPNSSLAGEWHEWRLMMDD